jgi:hypothetical protein
MPISPSSSDSMTVPAAMRETSAIVDGDRVAINRFGGPGDSRRLS